MFSFQRNNQCISPYAASQQLNQHHHNNHYGEYSSSVLASDWSYLPGSCICQCDRCCHQKGPKRTSLINIDYIYNERILDVIQSHAKNTCGTGLFKLNIKICNVDQSQESPGSRDVRKPPSTDQRPVAPGVTPAPWPASPTASPPPGSSPG